jgi:OPA family glycerol-3-phosphate transporter-like MFS transporter
MYASAILGGTVAVIWFFLKSRIVLDTPADSSGALQSSRKLKFSSAVIIPLAFIALGIIFQGMLRDGITSWTPTYLSEVFNYDAGDSIFYTVALAVFSIVCYTVIGEIYKRFFKNEVFCASLIFTVALLSCALLFAFFNVSGGVFTVAMLAVITGMMHGANLMLVSYVPKRFKIYGNISTVSGALNSCSYIGSAIFTYAVAVLSEKLQWRYTVGIWGIVAALGALCCIAAVPLWNKFIKNSEK